MSAVSTCVHCVGQLVSLLLVCFHASWGSMENPIYYVAKKTDQSMSAALLCRAALIGISSLNFFSADKAASSPILKHKK